MRNRPQFTMRHCIGPTGSIDLTKTGAFLKQKDRLAAVSPKSDSKRDRSRPFAFDPEAGLDEYWLQNQIVDNPACLGLGELSHCEGTTTIACLELAWKIRSD